MSEDAVVCVDQALRIRGFNRGAERIFGYDRTEALGSSLDLLIPDRFTALHAEHVWRFAESAEATRFMNNRSRIHGLRKDGTEFPAEASISKHTLGSEMRLAVILRDVSGHVLIEEELTRAVEDYRRLIEHANTPIFTLDSIGTIIQWNQAITRLTGCPDKEMLGRSFVNDVVAPGSKDYALSSLESALRGEDVSNIEISILSEKGRSVRLLLNFTKRWEGGSTERSGVVAVGQDISELVEYRSVLELVVRARTEDLTKAVAESQDERDRIEAIIKSVADGVLVTDPNRIVILANETFSALLGIDSNDINGQDVSQVIPQKELVEAIDRTVNGDSVSSTLDLTVVSADGITRFLWVRISLVTSQNGKVLGAVVLIQDTSELRAMDRLKSEFLSTAAHELRTPLTSILGFSEVLLTRETTPEKQKRLQRYIHSQALQLAAIVEDLLDLQKLEAGQWIEVNPQPIDLAELLNETVEVMEGLSRGRPIEITVEGVPAVAADRLRIAQVLRNLLSNAIKYSAEGSPIGVRAWSSNGTVYVSVADRGIGMTPEQQVHLFERFYRADGSNTSISGTGLGLAICKSIIEQHGGEIWVESLSGEGTTVTFSLPIRTSD